MDNSTYEKNYFLRGLPYKWLETGQRSYLKLMRQWTALFLKLFGDNPVYLAIDDSIVLRHSKKAPMSQIHHQHGNKTNLSRYVRGQCRVALVAIVKRSGFNTPLPLLLRLTPQAGNSGKLVIYIDLDGFKMVNDTVGHAAGDQVLQIMAERFKQFLRKNELIASLGGDEFCLLIYGNIDEFEINNLIKRLKNECIQEIVLNGTTFTLDMNLGIAIFPDDGTSYDELISCADQRMYADKQLKK